MYPILQYSSTYLILEYYVYFHTNTLYIYPVFLCPIYMYILTVSVYTILNLVYSGLFSFVFSILQTVVSRLCLPLSVIWDWEVMWQWTVKVLNLYDLPQKRHLGCSLSQPPECFLARSVSEIALRSRSWSVSCSGAVVWNFCMSSSCKPLLCIISGGSRQVFRQIKFSDKKCEAGWMCDLPCFRRACEGSQNLKWIKQILSELYLPQFRQLRQMTWGLTSADVRLTSGLTWQLSFQGNQRWYMDGVHLQVWSR